MAAVVDRVDAFQQRHRVVGFPLAVLYKFFDDQGNYLAAILTYYAFIAIFPLLLIASSVLGLLLRGNAELRQAVLTSALSQFPIVGTQLGAPQGLQGSVSAVVIGALAALYGVIGLVQAAQNAVHTAWAIPRNSRLNPLVSRLRSFVLMVLAGVTVLLVAMLSSASSHLSMFGADVNSGVRLLFTGLSVALNALVISLMLRLATAQRETLGQVLPGGITIAVLWQALQLLGGAYVSRVVSRAGDMNAIFAVVLGLLALIYIAAVMGVLGVEVNVVLARRLYPRALLTPFTDDVELTEADRRAYADYAKAQRHKGFQRVRVSFGQRPNGDGTPAPAPDQGAAPGEEPTPTPDPGERD